jgi:iron complex outermembrane recepter protein
MIRDFARHIRPQLSVTALAIGLLYTGAAHAQVTGASSAASSWPDAGEIVVTAQRHTERLVDIPISITAVDGAAFARTGST